MSYRVKILDKAIEKKEQHAELCKLLAAAMHDVMLLSVVLGSAGTLLIALIVQQKKWTLPMPGKETIQQASTTQFTKPCVRQYLERQKPTNLRSKGKEKGRLPSFLPQSVHRGRPVHRPTP
jgi:hypothetical protein